MPKKATKPRQRNLSIRQLRAQVRELNEDLERQRDYAKGLRSEIHKSYVEDEEKQLAVQRAMREKLDAIEMVDLLRERNRRTRAWNQKQSKLIEAMTLSAKSLKQDAERLRVERDESELACSILGYAFVNTPDGFTHEGKIRHLMMASEFLGINFSELRTLFELLLSFGYSATIPATLDRLLNKAKE